MRYHGVDIGVRSLYIFSDDGPHRVVAKKTSREDELSELLQHFRQFVGHGDTVFCEEPPLAGTRNIRTFMSLSQISTIPLLSGARCVMVPVATWKKHVVGHGNATKPDVDVWLATNHPCMHAKCADQNDVDAACLYLYGRTVIDALSFKDELG